MKVRFKYYALMFAASIACPVAANAAMVQFTFTQTVLSNDFGIPGFSDGDTVTLSFVADNRESSLNSQEWTYGDLLSGYLSVGTYWQSYTDGWADIDTAIAFKTDGAGLLTVNFLGTSTSIYHKDFTGSGGSIQLFQLGFNDRFGNYASFEEGFGTGFDTSPPGSSVEFVAPVPLPAAAWLLLSGLAGLGFVGRRRTAK